MPYERTSTCEETCPGCENTEGARDRIANCAQFWLTLVCPLKNSALCMSIDQVYLTRVSSRKSI